MLAQDIKLHFFICINGRSKILSPYLIVLVNLNLTIKYSPLPLTSQSENFLCHHCSSVQFTFNCNERREITPPLVNHPISKFVTKQGISKQ